MTPAPHPPSPSEGALRCVVLTADQRRSRSTPDAVPTALDALRGVAMALPFVRTAGDEIQGVLTDPAATATAMETLLRSGQWHLGIGLGSAELPLPDDTRAARGDAFVAAREAVEASGTSPGRPRVVPGSPADAPLADALEAAVWLWDALLDARTRKGWEVVDLLEQGLPQREAAERLGIVQSAVTQRAAAARLHEGIRARRLVEQLLAWHLGTAPGTTSR